MRDEARRIAADIVNCRSCSETLAKINKRRKSPGGPQRAEASLGEWAS